MTIRQCVNRIADAIDMSEHGAHAAVTVFSNSSQLRIKFSDFYTFYEPPNPPITSFKEAVGNLSFIGSGTKIDNGLKVAYEEMFQERNGMRIDSRKYLVLITDGQQNGTNYTYWANKFVNANITVIVLGVGTVNENDLSDLVAVDSDLHLAKNFDELLNSTFIQNINRCNGKL